LNTLSSLINKFVVILRLIELFVSLFIPQTINLIIPSIRFHPNTSIKAPT